MIENGYAVIFSSELDDIDAPAYHEFSTALQQEVTTMPGFLGMESYRSADGKGVTISYWESKEAIANWKNHEVHQAAQHYGKTIAYTSYTLRVCKIERAYQFNNQKE